MTGEYRVPSYADIRLTTDEGDMPNWDLKNGWALLLGLFHARLAAEVRPRLLLRLAAHQADLVLVRRASLHGGSGGADLATITVGLLAIVKLGALVAELQQMRQFKASCKSV